MKPIKLEELTPMGSSFILKATGKTYNLRPVNLADEAWMNRTFGGKLESVFKQVQMVEVAKITFHQMEEADKREFLQRDVSIINEEGVEVVKKLGGAELLLWLIQGWDEKMQIFKALLETIGVSRKMLDELSDQTNPPAKTDDEKKSQEQPTGQSSLTDLAQSTDGQQITSGL